MKINLKNLTEKIEQEDYLQDLASIKYADLSKSKAKIKETATKMVQETAMAIKKGSLSHIALEVTGQRPVTFALESNIINLPYSNYKKIANFFEEGKDYPVNIYFETTSDYLNASKFRIDQLATEAELQDEDAVIAKLTAAIAEKIKQVREYEKPAPVTKKAVAKKAAAKKTTTKKAAKKTTKAKKTTAKSSSAKSKKE
ncbi:hypothetical protein OZX69_08075 [Lactobacillus sp. ESL0731]|uniref:hypothetical protein n=1 Tax=unclassified Lactobacillus TaxID=2620435 RepID=UPI0023F87097|nr:MULTISPECIES: hypothetical protein [unclassified Lactobacillus]WEV50896.1 hypothetical protein OZX63_08070 [Lactobacillus sp. ESL0700]WEV62027.1 hypothetical protein OZX69_08075 [Lactobacillus sp. ESL0731]